MKTFVSLKTLRWGLLPHCYCHPNPVQTPYTERRVERDTSFTFNQGSENYVLRSPDNKAYVMQSYSHIVDDSQSLDTLPSLAARLALPAGWTFSVLTVEEDLVVEDVAGIATVVQDEFQNTYQQAPLNPNL